MSAVLKTLALGAAAAAGAGAVWLFAPHLLPAGPEAPAAEPAHQAAAAHAPASFTVAPGQVVTVGEMSAAGRIRLGGTVVPEREVSLTAQAPGRVTYVAGEEGDRVSEGDVVIGLDTGALDAQYQAAWADLGQQMAGLENARVQLYQNIYGPATAPMGGAPYAAFDQATTPFYNMFQSFMGGMPGTNGGRPMQTQAQSQRNFATASAARFDYERQMAALAAAQSRLDGLDAQLRDRRAVAPWNGAILTRHVRVGDIVQPGQPLAEFADVDALAVKIDVPVAMVAGLHLGDKVPLTIEGNNLWAPVTQIYPSADAAAHTVPVKMALPAGAPAAPGMYALAWIAQPESGSPADVSPAVPANAIAYRGSLPVAFVLGADGQVEMRVLRLGDQQGDRIAVLSGLKTGEQVVTNPPPGLKSGDRLSGG